MAEIFENYVTDKSFIHIIERLLKILQQKRQMAQLKIN
jgi:hypothetical protein